MRSNAPYSTETCTRRRKPDEARSLTPPLNAVGRRYQVRFAQTAEDVEAVFRLRFEVFNLELGEGLEASYATGRDEDRFDAHCQHLMVIHNDSGETVGTYRLQVAEAAEAGEGFYSASEFELSALPDDVISGAVELGRACIRSDHRNREALFLLWKGLTAYVIWNKKRYFFGCSSLTSTDPVEGLRTFEHLAQGGYVHARLCVPPLPGFECVASGPEHPLPDVHIPTLFRTYLRYGAKVIGPPAIDRAFKTVDFLTLVDFDALDSKTIETFTR